MNNLYKIEYNSFIQGVFLIALGFLFSCNDGSDQITIEEVIAENAEVVIDQKGANGNAIYGYDLQLGASILSEKFSEAHIKSQSWSSNLDGNVSNELIFTTNSLSPGTHNLKLTVTFIDDSNLEANVIIVNKIDDLFPQIEIELSPPKDDVYYDTDFINLGTNVTHESGKAINYKTIEWQSDIDDNLNDHTVRNKYFFSNNEHKLTALITFHDGFVLEQSLNLSIQNDPRGKWIKDKVYEGVGNENYTHDGLVLETPNFFIFSNTSNASKRLILSEYAERSLSELKASFNIEQVETNGKILIAHNSTGYNGFVGINHNLEFSMYIAMPENDFVVLTGPDEWNRNIEGVKHELVHIFELTYMLHSPSEITTHRWFWEGIAVYESKGPIIDSWSGVEEWRNETEGNPIAVKEQPQGSSSDDGHYYPMYGLSLAYLLDPEGNNNSRQQIKNLYSDIKNGSSFEAAFENNMGISESYFESNFFSLIQLYLE